MALSPNEVKKLVEKELYPLWSDEKDRLDRIDQWYRWSHEPIAVPRGATPELKALIELAKTPWLRLVVSTLAQSLRVDGFQSPNGSSNEAAWRIWQRNDFDSRQAAIHRASLAYGYSFATALPGQDPEGNRAAVLRGVSPRKMQALYDDPASDDYPQYAAWIEKRGESYFYRVYDEDVVHYLQGDSFGSGLMYVRYEEHGVGVCPVVRYCNMLDLDGRADGEIEPFIPTAQRINKTIYDRLMTQHFASWKVRTVAGMLQPKKDDGTTVDTEAAAQKKIQLRQDDILIAEDPDTKFGSLPESPLQGFIEAVTDDIKALATTSQTPTFALTGDLVNLAADAIDAARAEFEQKKVERQLSLGKSHDQLLRLGSFIEGDQTAAYDFESHVSWQDTSSRSFAQVADALGKVATMLQVPVEALWARVPGVTKLDVDEWKALAEEQRAQAELAARLNEAADGGNDTGDGTDNPAQGGAGGTQRQAAS